MLRLSNIALGKLRSNVAHIVLSNSFAHIVWKPAFSNPKSNPPAPLKKIQS